jgi:pSer/pThr/pTyr-binding forkhead associated (FHA) protein
MSTIESFEREATSPQIDAPTQPLPATTCDAATATETDAVRDSFALLDHRARARAIPRGLAPRGHYLGFGDGNLTQLIRLEPRITHVGRSAACDVRLEDRRVSRDHAIIVRHGRYARVLDNRSMNGTFVNGYRIVATNIRNGDVIGVGPLTMSYVDIP